MSNKELIKLSVILGMYVLGGISLFLAGCCVEMGSMWQVLGFFVAGLLLCTPYFVHTKRNTVSNPEGKNTAHKSAATTLHRYSNTKK